MRARAHDRLSGGGDLISGEERRAAIEPLGSQGLHYVHKLAQQFTERALTTLVEIMENEGETGATRRGAAVAVLEWGWVKPGAAAAGKGAAARTGGQGLKITVKSAVNPGVETTITLGSEENHAPEAIDVTPEPDDADL